MHNMIFTVLCLVQISLPRVHTKYLAYFEKQKNWLKANETCSKCGGKLVNWDKKVSEIISRNNIKNKIIWIGNYTRQYPWIREIGFVKTSSLEYYNIIHHNTPEFCSRTCSDDQYFALEGEKCYCIKSEKIGDILCAPSYDYDDNYCMDDHVTVLKIDEVYTCDFENTSCKNTSFGNQERGLVWKRTKHYGTGSTEIKNDYDILLQSIGVTAETKARFSVRLNLENMYYCLSLKYYMNYSGSIEVYVSKETGESYVAWKKYGNKGDMWYTSVVDIKGHNNLTIDIYGSIESFNIGSVMKKIAIDDIKLKPLACNKEVLLYCPFLTDICDLTVERKIEVFLRKYKGVNSLFMNQGGDISKTYTVRTPLIKVNATSNFCLTFSSYIYNKYNGYLTIKIKTEDSEASLLNSFELSKRQWYNYPITIQANKNYVILIEFKSKSNFILISNLTLEYGICYEEEMQKPIRMCPIIDIEDNLRLSVGLCSNMTHSYICEFGNEEYLNVSECSSFLSLNESITETATTDETLHNTTRVKRATTDISSFLPITSTDQPTTNTSKKVTAGEQKETKMEFVVGFGILLAVVVVLVVLAAWLCYKLKRNQASVKEKEPISYVGSIQNRGYEMAAVDTSHIQPPPADGTGYELASPVKDQQQRSKENNIYSNENSQNKFGNDYQNYENYTGDHRHDSQVYQETGEGDYDHLGESARRRKDLNSENDNLYDHGQTINSRNNGLYDTTKPETVDDYFLLEPENGATRESEIYDHTK